jgi:zinc protease
MYPSISYSTDQGHQAHALDVAMEVLGGSETSWLYRELVENQRLAVSAGVSADTSGIGGGTISLYATPAEGVSLERLEAAMDQIVARFLAEGPSAAEIERAKNNLAAAAIYARDDQESMAQIYGSSLAEGESIDDIVNWPDDIKRVTRDEALAMARQTLNLNASVTGWLLPQAPEQAAPARGAQQ